ncbi:MAG: hypothetical protein OEY11_02520 [Gammaproteobacteria bacterium]|nr:hypothetical protein [Gammaproteobacteria bacterium]
MQTTSSKADQDIHNAGILTDNGFALKILFSSDEPAKLGKRFLFSASDTSKNTISISSRESIILNSVLDLCITDTQSNEQFFVTADVKKCSKEKNSSEYRASLQLKDRVNTSTDLYKWQQRLKETK